MGSEALDRAATRRQRRTGPAIKYLAVLTLVYAVIAVVLVAGRLWLPDPAVITNAPAAAFATFLRAGAAMLGALVLCLPVAGVFLVTRRSKGFSQSVVHTLIVLPIAVAGIMALVQNSLPLAFGLAGIAFLRFRNTLADTKDAVYLFVAIGVGIAAAAGQLEVGLALSFLFTFSVVILWWTDVGRMPASVQNKLELRRLRRTMETRIPTAAAPRPTVDPLNAALRVHASDVSSAQTMVEAVLDNAAKRWELTGVTPGEHGFSTLDYVVRLRRQTGRGELLNDLRQRGRPHVVGAEYR